MSTTPTPKSAATKTFTLNDLAKIALGAPELTRDHLSVLQSLLIILLRKLNCHNETVRLHGFSGKCLQKILNETSHKSQYDFQLQTLKGYQEKYDLLEKLEQRLQDSQTKLEGHFQQIRKCHKTNIFQAKMWDFYAAPNEDLCTLYMPHNKEFCILARNPVFNRTLRDSVTHPLVEHMKEFENKIENMQKKLQELTKKANESATTQNYVKYIIQDIESIRPLIRNSEEIFREAMIETQEMLNCKLERVALPALKKYLDQRFLLVQERLEIFKKEEIKCAPTKPLIITKTTCLSCSRHHELKHLHGFKPIKSVNEEEICFCTNVLKEPTILEKLDRLATMPYDVNATTTSALCLLKMTIKDNKTANDGERTKIGSVVQQPHHVIARVSKKSIPNEQSYMDDVNKLKKIKSVRLNRYHYGT